MFFKKKEFVIEENVKIPIYGKKITKKLNVFYNPVMKLNRDISLLFIETYFKSINKKAKFCDPMAASGIREIRFLKTIPSRFEELIIGDISKTAIKNIKKNFKENKISLKKVKLLNENAMNTISSTYFNFIELDPFGTPVPFLDISCQRIKHEGILSVTATDTAALCGTYPKTTFRRYGIRNVKTLWYDELGIRNLIAYVQREAAKYDKVAKPILSYSNNHYYKVFFKIEESKTNCIKILNQLKYLEVDPKTQDIKILNYSNENTIGKTYVGPLQDIEFLEELKTNLNLLESKKDAGKLIDSLINEIDIVGYYNPHKLQKKFKFGSSIKFETLINQLHENGFKVSRPHNNRLGIKTNAKAEDIIKIMKLHVRKVK